MTTANATDAGSVTPREAAQLAQAEHSRLVELLMVTTDLLDDVQQNRSRQINVPNLRKAASHTMRQSAEAHAVALAYLVGDEDEEYAETLISYADEMAPGEAVS